MSINTSLGNVQSHNKKHPNTDHTFTGSDVVLGASSGTPAEIDFAESATATTIPIRDSNGDMIVPATPTNDNGAAGKKFVEDLLAGARDPKDSVRLATDAALPANTRTGNVLDADVNGALPSIDSVAPALNDRILVQDEATGANNGYYSVTDLGSGITKWKLTRTTDADASSEVTSGMSCWVEEGTVNGQHRFVLNVTGTVTLNTTALTFVKHSGLGQITAGLALTKGGDTLDWVPDDITLEVALDKGQIKDLGVSTAKLAANAVTSAKLANNAVTATQLATDAVATAKIAANAVTTAKIAAGAVGISELADQKAEIALAGTTPVLADFSTLTADGHWAFGKGTDNSGWLCVAINAGGLKKYSVQLGEVTS